MANARKTPSSTAPPATQRGNDHPYILGANYFIRTVTHHYTGRLVAVYALELVLVDVAWIADDGRFAQAMASGDFSEVEPWPDGTEVVVGRGSIEDASICPFALPRSQK